MEHNTDRILWTVLVLAIGIGLYVPFHASASSLLQQGVDKIQTVATNVNSNKSDDASNLVDEDDNSPFAYQYDTNAKTATITGYKLNSGDALLTKLEIPAYKKHDGVKYTVTSIGAHVFNSMPAPTQGVSVTLPNTIKTIGDSAFASEAITSINLPEGLVSIGSNAFYYTELTNVTIPSTLETIGSDAFSGDLELTSVDMSNATSLTSISDGAFSDDPIASLKLPLDGKLSSIGAGSFQGTALTKIEIPASVTKIGYQAFQHITKGVPVVIHSSNGAITYVVDDQGTTSTTPAPSTFGEMDDDDDDGGQVNQ